MENENFKAEGLVTESNLKYIGGNQRLSGKSIALSPVIRLGVVFRYLPYLVLVP